MGRLYLHTKNLSTTPTLDEATAVEYARTGLTDGDRAEVTSSELIIYAPGDTPPRLAWKLELAIGLTVRWLVVIDAENGDELTAYNQVMHQAHWDECMVFDDPPRPHHFSVRNDNNVVDLFGVPRPLNIWRQDSIRWMIDTRTHRSNSARQGWHDWIQHGAIWVRDAQNQEILIDAPVVCQKDPEKVNPPYSDPPYSWLPDAVSASYNLSQVYDYYRERHERNSFDGRGASIHAIVRYGQNFKNAFWLPGSNLIVFGDGRPFAGALDIVGHELTHGVIEHSANLLYQDQPGALNEAFADIFGEMVEAHSKKDEPDWITGGDLVLPASGGGGPDLGRPIRNMKDPGAFLTHLGRPYPSKMSQFFHIRENNGGIHINNTIITHAFYLLVQGLKAFYESEEGREALRDLPETGCPASRVTSRNNARQSVRHAMCDAERIFYHALTTYLVQNSDFVDTRMACEMAAKYLIEKQYIPALAAEETAKAFVAVGIDGGGTTPNSPIPSARGSEGTLFVYRDVLGQFRLGRREAAQGDGDQGVQLAGDVVVRARPSVSRDGSLAVFVNAENDLCFIATDGTGQQCLESPDPIAAAAMSPDGRLLGVILLSELGNSDNKITIVNRETGGQRTFLLTPSAYTVPVPDTLPYASTINFTADGQWLIYDALNAVTVSGDEDALIERGQWSLYALDLQTGRGFPLIPPERGVHYAFPALGQINDNWLTFDRFDETRNQSTVYTAKLWTGEMDMEEIATVQGGFGVPGFTGNDKALVFSQYDPNVSTGFSLCEQPLQDDKVPCAGLDKEDAEKVRDGNLSEDDWHLGNAEMGVIYRRPPLSRPGLTGRLESPSHGSSQESGVVRFSGWVCVTGPGGEPPPPAVPEVAERYFYDGLEHRESSVDNRGNWWARTGSGNKTHITGRTTVQEVADQVRRFTISYVDDTGHDRTGFYETLLGASGIFTIDIGNVRLSWPITRLSENILPPDSRRPAGTVIPPRITIDVEPGATVRNQDGSPWVPVPLTQTMDELGRSMYVVNILEDYVPGRSEVSSVEIEINNMPPIPVRYGTPRRDTTSVCGDSNNGFFWRSDRNPLPEGTDTVRAIADGVEFDSATFTVTTQGAEFLRSAER